MKLTKQLIYQLDRLNTNLEHLRGFDIQEPQPEQRAQDILAQIRSQHVNQTPDRLKEMLRNIKKGP